MRHLVADMHGQVLLAGVPHRGAAARLDRRVRLPVLVEARFDHHGGPREPARRIAGAEPLVRDEVAGQALIDARRIRRERALDARYRRQRLVDHLDARSGVLGEVAVGRHDAGDGIADEAHLVDRQRAALDRQQALDRRRQPQRRCPLRNLTSGDDRMHAAETARVIAVDRDNARMGVRRAQEVGMQRARDRDVVEEAAAAGEEAAVFAPQQRPADGRILAHARASSRLAPLALSNRCSRSATRAKLTRSPCA